MFFNTHTSSGLIYLDDISNTKPGISVSKYSAADLEMLENDRLKFLNNPLIACLNINSLRNKVIELGVILKELPLDYLVISETKLDDSFPNAQFKINGYEGQEEIEINTEVDLLNLLGKALSPKD